MRRAINAVRRWLCEHRFSELYGDLRAEPDGTLAFHEVYWRCDKCGKLSMRGCSPDFVAMVERTRPWERQKGTR